MNQDLWQRINKDFKDIRLKKGKDFYPYIGKLKCEYAFVPKINIAGRALENARISVFPDDSLLLEECDGMLGMQYFLDTVIVLDFERNLLWVKGD